MQAKLTLIVEKSIIKMAKRHAKKSGRSISELVENYLGTLTMEHGDKERLSPKLKKIAGVIRLPEDFEKKNFRIKGVN